MDIGWREFFKDARLQTLIATALENNRDLKIAALRIEEARSLYGIQWADRLPTVNATGSGSRGRTPPDLSTTKTSIIGSSYSAGASLASFELDFFGRVKSLTDAALATYLASEEAQRSAHISLVAEVAKAYLAERAYAEQLDLAQKSYKAREESYKLAKIRFDVGATSALDLAQYDSLLQSAKVAMVTLAGEPLVADRKHQLLHRIPPGGYWRAASPPGPSSRSSPASASSRRRGSPPPSTVNIPKVALAVSRTGAKLPWSKARIGSV